MRERTKEIIIFPYVLVLILILLLPTTTLFQPEQKSDSLLFDTENVSINIRDNFVIVVRKSGTRH